MRGQIGRKGRVSFDRGGRRGPPRQRENRPKQEVLPCVPCVLCGGSGEICANRRLEAVARASWLVTRRAEAAGGSRQSVVGCFDSRRRLSYISCSRGSRISRLDSDCRFAVPAGNPCASMCIRVAKPLSAGVSRSVRSCQLTVPSSQQDLRIARAVSVTQERGQDARDTQGRSRPRPGDWPEAFFVFAFLRRRGSQGYLSGSGFRVGLSGGTRRKSRNRKGICLAQRRRDAGLGTENSVGQAPPYGFCCVPSVSSGA